jgi:hypothetical protein
VKRDGPLDLAEATTLAQQLEGGDELEFNQRCITQLGPRACRSGSMHHCGNNLTNHMVAKAVDLGMGLRRARAMVATAAAEGRLPSAAAQVQADAPLALHKRCTIHAAA